MKDDQNLPLLLLVEYDHALQSIFVAALADEGFEVLTTNSGTTAIKVLDKEDFRLKALITDIRLGKGPNSWDVGRRGRELFSAVPVIYMSGDSAYEWSANGVPESLMLQKPFAIARLITAVTLINLAGNATALSDAMAADANIMPPSDWGRDSIIASMRLQQRA